MTGANKPQVVVVGGGIGGLSCALMLHELGLPVTVYESAAEIRPLGVGINVLPHAMAVLQRIGLMDAIVDRGVRTFELCFLNRFGQLIWREPRGLHAGYPVPQVSVHRGGLQLALLDAVRERLGPDAVRCGHVFQSSRELASGRVEARFLDRARDAEQRVSADILIGADGIHSTVRRQFYPDEGAPKWNGQILWRAVSQAKPYLTGRSMFMAGSNRTKFVAYPITEPGADGLCTINWIAELNCSDQPLRDREDWNRRGERSEFAPTFASWRFDWLDIPALIDSADEIFEFPMVDRDPVSSWTFGRVTLLGDAAHAMYPIGSNGASQAILDAWALAGALRAHADADADADGDVDVDAALAEYQAERLPATSAIIAANRRGGPEHVLDLADQRAPNGFADISEVFAPGELEQIALRYKQVAGFTLDRVR